MTVEQIGYRPDSNPSLGSQDTVRKMLHFPHPAFQAVQEKGMIVSADEEGSYTIEGVAKENDESRLHVRLIRNTTGVGAPWSLETSVIGRDLDHAWYSEGNVHTIYSEKKEPLSTLYGVERVGFDEQTNTLIFIGTTQGYKAAMEINIEKGKVTRWVNHLPDTSKTATFLPHVLPNAA